jgi:general secretion pathway protein D
VIDRQQNLTINDFRDLNDAEKLTKGSNAKDLKEGEVKISTALGAPPVPDLAQVLAAPRAPKVANAKLVTLSVTEDVPLRDVLFELGRLANVDIELGSGLDKSGVNLRATDRPFNEVIERISTLANLRYSVTGNSIRIERDLPYIKNYSLDFLNIVRSSNSSYNVSTSVLSGGGGGSGGSSSSGGGSSGGGSSGGSTGSGTVGTSGSNSAITTQAESDLWAALEASVTEILSYNAAGTEDSTAAPAAAAGGGASGRSSNFVINRQAGVLSVNATEKQHEMVQRFLTLMSRNSSAQVLIEAKIVEVSLSDQFLSGVDWTKVLGDKGKSNIDLGTNRATLTSFTAPANPFSISLAGDDLNAVITATQHFGTTHTLSSPRLAAINNQQAVLTFATNEVFFDCTYTAPSTTSSGTTTTGSSTSTNAATFNCEANSVPIGIILNILPSINLDTQEVTLNVRPTLTRKTSDKVSPTAAFLRSQGTTAAASQIPDTSVPVIQVREIDSITKVKSGGVMVIGGLMEDVSVNDQTGVPGVSELPFFGNLFKSRAEDAKKTELIIFIKATIVNPDGSSHQIDRAIYNKYMTDPRPLFPKQ